jgi:hypothetical protein
MATNLAQVQVTGFNGLVASLRPAELPDGASPRCIDMDFVTARTMQRPGEQNVYSYSGLSIGPNPAFSAVDTPAGGTPAWANPGNILLNDGSYASVTPEAPITLSVTNVEVIHGSFGSSQIVVTFGSTSPPAGSTFTFSGLTGYTALNGQALIAASASGNQATFIEGFPTTGYGPAPDTGFASVASSVTTSDYLDVTNFTFAIPGTQGITGIQVSINGKSSSVGTPGLTAQILAAGTVRGLPQNLSFTASETTQSVGGAANNFGSALTPAIANATSFGIRLQASGTGTIFLDYVEITLFLTSALPNFNYEHTFKSPTGIDYNLAFDATGTWWIENVSSNPNVLNEILSGCTANSWASGTTVYDRAFITNMNLLGQVTGNDLPRQYNFEGGWWDRITQIGPGAPPTITASEAAGAIATITAVTIGASTATITAVNTYVAGEVGTFSGLTGPSAVLNGLTLIVLSTGLSGTQFEVAFTGTPGGPYTGLSGTFTPQYTYPITSIVQPPQQSDPGDTGHFQNLLWSAGPGSTSAGNTITVYYSDSFVNPQPDTQLVNAFNAGFPVYVYITNAPFGNGIWQVTSIGNAIPPGGAYFRWYFTYQVPTSNYQDYGGPDDATGFYQVTQATVTTAAPVPGLAAGAQVSIAGVSPSTWDDTYPIVEAVNSGAFNISQTSLADGIATYSWTLTSGVAPAAGDLVTVTNTLNANGILNVADALIATATGVSSGTFTISGFAASLSYPTAVEEGQATTAGTEFIIDPGAPNVGSTTVNPIYGNGTGGTLTVVGTPSGGTLPIGAGTRQGVVIFITRNGLYTAPSPPITFTVAQGANYIICGNIPLGPPNVIARLIALTEAGQNGVPGANFYTTTVPSIFTVGGVQYTSSSFLIPDNQTTSAKFTFSDAVLLQSDAIDIPGNNLFNLIQIGNPAVVLQYAERTFYIGSENKVQNFNNTSMDGGYLQPTGGAPAVPLGWNIDSAYSFPFGTSFTIATFSITGGIVTFTCPNTLSPGLNVIVNGLSIGTYLNGVLLNVQTASGGQFTAAFVHADVPLTTDSGTVRSVSQTLQLRPAPSPQFGNSLYVVNQTASAQAVIGMITQSAFEDAYNAPILNPVGVPVPYSVRIVCRTPSSATVGSITVDLVDSNQGLYGHVYATFTLALSSITNQMATYTGVLVPEPGLATITPGLLLRVYGTEIQPLGDYEIKSVDLYPTNEPVLTNTVLVSYAGEPEQVDGVTGQLTLSSQNQDPVYGATIIHDQLCFKKRNSIIECEDAANYEPSEWTTREVSQRVGTCGPNAFAQGDEWDLSLHETGFYVYQGGAPMVISRELQGFASGDEFWDSINWNAKQTFWLANDLRARRFYAGVAMPTPNPWLPNAPTSNPAQPNVILMCNYDGCPTAGELEAGAPVHVTMFGSIKALDMRRKWSVWQIVSPYAGIVLDGTEGIETLYICNGTGTGKIYRLIASDIQMTDDGTPIAPLYITSGQPDKEKAQALGIGLGQKYAASWMANMQGSSVPNGLRIRHYQNTLADQYPVPARYVPPLAPTMQNNIEWKAEVRGQRFFTEFSMNQNGNPVAGYFELGELMCEMQAHQWGAFRGVSQ